MQEARNVVSPSRWQTQSVDDRDETGDQPAATAEAADDRAETAIAEAETAAATEDRTEGTREEIATDEPAPSQTAEAADVDTAEAVTTPTEYDYGAVPRRDPPGIMDHLGMPLLTIVAACAVIGGLWSYSAQDELRAQLADTAKAKAALERSLADAQARLTVAEKAVADVKAAIAAATGAAAAKAPAAK